MTPEIRRGDIGTGRHGENRVQRRRYCGVIRQRHRQRRFISWRIILTNGKTCCTVCSSNSIDCIPLSANVTAAPDEGCTVKSSIVSTSPYNVAPLLRGVASPRLRINEIFGTGFPDTVFHGNDNGNGVAFFHLRRLRTAIQCRRCQRDAGDSRTRVNQAPLDTRYSPSPR